MLQRFAFCLLAVAGCMTVGDDGEVADSDDLPPPAETLAPDPAALPGPGGMPAALCDAAHPVKLTIGMTGIDGFNVHATVGVDLADDSESVDREGIPDQDHISYPIVLNFNPTYDYEGMPGGTAGGVRTWTGCVGAKVKRVYVEAYPRDATGKTNRTKYGESVYQYAAIQGAGSYTVNMRFPLVTEYAQAKGLVGAGTGNIFGHVMCNGAEAIPDHARLRVWSSQPGNACGMRAYSASAEPSTTATYKFTALAGGQCNAPSQPVAVYVRGNCNGKYREVKKLVDITTGKTLPLNIELAGGIDRGPTRTY